MRCPEELSIKSKIILLESVLNDLSKITALDETSKNLFDLAKENNDYEDVKNQFKVILVRADSDCVDKVWINIYNFIYIYIKI